LVDAAGVRKAGESTEDECNDKDDTTIGWEGIGVLQPTTLWRENGDNEMEGNKILFPDLDLSLLSKCVQA
jgi:hypothetical protein